MDSNVEKNEPEYEIGYKKPPKDTQFKPRQRANPKGRRPSENLLAGINPTRLSRDEQTELSRVLERIDSAGGFIDLSNGDFAAAEKLLQKGRGQDVGPNVDGNQDRAA